MGFQCWHLMECWCTWNGFSIGSSMAARHMFKCLHNWWKRDFKTILLSRKSFDLSTWNFYHWLVSIGGCVLSNFAPIRNPIWLPGCHLGFFSIVIPRGLFEQSIWDLNHWLVSISGCVLSNIEPIGNPTWLPGRHLIFSFRCYIWRTMHLSNQFEI